MNEQPNLDLPIPASEVATSGTLPRLRFPFLCLLFFWAGGLIVGTLDKPYFIGFMYSVASAGLITLLFFGWWWFNRRLRFSEKVLGFALIVGGAWTVGKYSHHSIGYFTLWMGGIPLVATVIVVWLYFVKRLQVSSLALIRLGFVAVVTFTWSSFLFIRSDGADSQLKAQKHWRWTPTPEQEFLAKSQASPAPANLSQRGTNAPVETALLPGDWISFRGTNRDGIVRETTIATNWTANPPKLNWKHDVGPSWSSLLLVGNRVFTQEQRGEKETVVCYDARDGSQSWVYEDTTRFDETVSGPGPRSTPTYFSGHLYTLGGTGLLNCLDAETGKTLWRRDIKSDSGARTPSWGFSSSPLVAGDLVVVYAGGDAGKSLVAYRINSGELVWTTPAGASSYSSPQLTTIEGVAQCLMLHDSGLTSVDILTGKKLWETGLIMKGAPRCGQPRLIDGNKLLVATLGGLGSSLIEVSKNADVWTVANKWDSKDLKPEFPDFVVHQGYAYGFDIGLFCCINLADGKRSWKEGRYGRGEVMLLADQGLLLITSETGELVLLAADPAANKEYGRFQALVGKTWNHPIVRGNQVYLKNAQEIACYTLAQGPARL